MAHSPTNPNRGLLSRTVFASPEIRFVFPVCVRSPSFNDIAFIGDTFVRIEEVQNDGRLLPVVSKTDFACRICAAQVLGDRPFTTISSPKPKPASSTTLSPQLLLLTLESKELVLLTTTHDAEKNARIVLVSQPLPDEISPARAPSRHLAVDPHSRALAVAAHSKAVYINDVKPRHEWTNHLEDVTGRALLLANELDVAVMDFLFPPPSKQNWIFLLIIGFSRGRLTMMLYEWEYGGKHRPSLIPQTIPARFFREHGMPQMLIPIEMNPGDFILVCDRNFALYTDAHLGQPTESGSVPLTEFCETSHYEQDSPTASRIPLWKAWARPNRNARDKRENEEEDFYLAREDGVVCLFILRRSWGIQVAGKLNGHVEGAFNHDGRGLHLPDGIVYGGSLSDGGIYEIGRGLLHNGEDTRTRSEVMSFRQTETIYNWAPFTDLTVAYPNAFRTDKESRRASEIPNMARDVEGQNSPARRPKIFGTSGRAPYGAVSQLRYGCEAIIEKIITIAQDERTTGIAGTRVWSFKGSHGSIELLLSSPNGSQLLVLLPHVEEAPLTPPITTEEVIEAAKIDLGAGSSSGERNAIALVTPSSIELVGLAEGSYSVTELAVLRLPGIMAASIYPEKSLILVADRNTLSLYRIDFSSDGSSFTRLGNLEKICAEPTCASLFAFGSSVKRDKPGQPDDDDDEDDEDDKDNENLQAAVGLASGNVVVFNISLNSGFGPRSLYPVCGSSESQKADACASITTMETDHTKGRTQRLLMCGLRSGVLSTAVVRRASKNNPPVVDSIERISIGVNPVIVSVDENNTHTAILHCGEEVLCLVYRPGTLRHPSVNYVWFMDHLDRSYTQNSISTVAVVPPDPARGSLGQLVAISGSDLSVSSLLIHPKALPLRLSVKGTPSRICYSPHYERLFVASVVTYTERDKRWNVATICIVDPTSASYETPEPSYYCEVGERITSLVEWMFVRDGKQYHHLVATTIRKLADGKTCGRILFLKVARIKGGKVMVKMEDSKEQVEERRRDHFFLDVAKIYDDERPIFSMCPLDNETLIYCSGDTIKKYIYNADDQRSRMQPLCRLGPAGPGQYITARKPFIFVSTKTGSVSVFRIEDDQAVPYASDDREREGLSHLLVDDSGSDTLLWSDKAQSLAGMRLAAHPGSPFTAQLPMSVTSLRKADVRPPWKRTPIPGAVERDVLGVSADGSLRSFTILDEHAWRLLRFLQNMCLRHAKTKPTGHGSKSAMAGHIEADTGRGSNMHIDGDILATLLGAQDAAGILQSMLDAKPEIEDEPEARTDFATAEARRGRFTALVRALHDSTQEAVEGEMSDDDAVESCSRSLEALGKDPIEGALEYVRDVLALPF